MGRRRSSRSSVMYMARMLDRSVAAARKETARQEQIAYSEYFRLSQENQKKYMILNPDGVLAKKFKREEDEKKAKFRKEVDKYKTLNSEQKQVYKELYPDSQAFIVGDAELKQRMIKNNSNMNSSPKTTFDIFSLCVSGLFIITIAFYLHPVLGFITLGGVFFFAR
jgi:trehalose/maltose hydrolase-like predicted phosphorylase